MEEIRQYVFSITATAAICGIFSALLKDNHVQSVVRFLLGIILMCVILRPLSSLNLTYANGWSSYFSDTSKIHTDAGASMGHEALRQRIKEEVQAYILSKAEELNIDLQTEIILDPGDIPVPTAVKLYGDPADGARVHLQEFIESELGIAKENQQWIGPN